MKLIEKQEVRRETRALEIENNRRQKKGLKKIDDINQLDEDGEKTDNTLDDDTSVVFSFRKREISWQT